MNKLISYSIQYDSLEHTHTHMHLTFKIPELCIPLNTLAKEGLCSSQFVPEFLEEQPKKKIILINNTRTKADKSYKKLVKRKKEEEEKYLFKPVNMYTF